MKKNTNNPNLHSEENDGTVALAGDLEALETELAHQKDLYLRLVADFDNFRKRTVQEVEQRASAKKEAFIKELLPAVDNLERALAVGASASTEQLLHGVQMTLQQLHQLLLNNGIEPEESLGQSFDPHRHEAIRAGHDPTKSDQSVLEVFQCGYRQGAGIFRPAKVVVNDLSQIKASANATHAG